jgi:hypothetical protein
MSAPPDLDVGRAVLAVRLDVRARVEHQPQAIEVEGDVPLRVLLKSQWRQPMRSSSISPFSPPMYARGPIRQAGKKNDELLLVAQPWIVPRLHPSDEYFGVGWNCAM